MEDWKKRRIPFKYDIWLGTRVGVCRIPLRKKLVQVENRNGNGNGNRDF